RACAEPGLGQALPVRRRAPDGGPARPDAGGPRRCDRHRHRRGRRSHHHEEDAMNVDLEQSLDRLARSVGDAVAAERLGGQVHRMVARIRRRRAARRTATGVVGVGAAAAVGVGGVQYLGRESAPQPPAEPTPDMLVVPVDACGMTLGQLGWTGVGPVGIEAVEGPPTGREDGGVTLATEVVKHDAVELRLDATAPRYVAVDPQTALVTGVPDAGEPFPEPDWALAGERF